MKDLKIRGILEIRDNEIILRQPNGELISLVDLIEEGEGSNIEITAKEADLWGE